MFFKLQMKVGRVNFYLTRLLLPVLSCSTLGGLSNSIWFVLNKNVDTLILTAHFLPSPCYLTVQSFSSFNNTAKQQVASYQSCWCDDIQNMIYSESNSPFIQVDSFCIHCQHIQPYLFQLSYTQTGSNNLVPLLEYMQEFWHISFYKIYSKMLLIYTAVVLTCVLRIVPPLLIIPLFRALRMLEQIQFNRKLTEEQICIHDCRNIAMTAAPLAIWDLFHNCNMLQGCCWVHQYSVQQHFCLQTAAKAAWWNPIVGQQPNLLNSKKSARALYHSMEEFRVPK